MAVFRELAEVSPDRCRPDLGSPSPLCPASASHSRSRGRPTDALSADQEAAVMYRDPCERTLGLAWRSHRAATPVGRSRRSGQELDNGSAMARRLRAVPACGPCEQLISASAGVARLCQAGPQGRARRGSRASGAAGAALNPPVHMRPYIYPCTNMVPELRVLRFSAARPIMPVIAIELNARAIVTSLAGR